MTNELTRTALCYPMWHAKFWPLTVAPQVVLSSGCALDAQGNIACAPEAMRAATEAKLKQIAPGLFPGALSLETYTLARYMQSEIGDGTLEERVAVGEAAVNQAMQRAGLTRNWQMQLNQMLLPNGQYGAIHAPDAYCASIGKGPGCNAANRWAATSRDPSLLSILLAHLVTSGSSGGIAREAETQWGPDVFKFRDQTRINSPAQVRRFVETVAKSNDQRYYWVGPIAGVDPWRTFLVKKGPSPTSPLGMAMMEMGIQALLIDTAGRPIRPNWEGTAVCGENRDEGRGGNRGRQILIGALLVGGLIGASWLTLRAVRGVAT